MITLVIPQYTCNIQHSHNPTKVDIQHCILRKEMVTNTPTKSNNTNPFTAFAEITMNNTNFYEADNNNKDKKRAVIP
eukprot:2981398-Ditylum_brightwellii.AAC.1